MDDDRFKELTHVSDRYHGVEEGIELLEKIFADFALQRDITITWFSKTGSQLLFPHPLNIRGHKQVFAKYVVWVKKYSLTHGIRGSAWVVSSANLEPPYYLITWGSLGGAVYEAFKTSGPESKKVELTKEKGLRGVTVFDHRTPAQVAP